MRIPKYRRRPDRDSGFSEFQGKRYHFPGKFDSEESRKAYHEFVKRAIDLQSHTIRAVDPLLGVTVGELVVAHLDWAKGYYMTDGRQDSEFFTIRTSMKRLIKLHETTPVELFGPTQLKSVRQAMVDADLARGVVNMYVGRIVRMFRWGVEHEVVKPHVYHALKAVPGLAMGRTEAREGDGVFPPKGLERLLPTLPDSLRAILELMKVSGMRPGEACSLTPEQIDRSGPVWEYRPKRHKTQRRGGKRVVFLGPKAQAILAPYLDREPHSRLFQKAPTIYYTTHSLSTQVGAAIKSYNLSKKSGEPPIEHFAPNSIRHLFATEVRRQYGLEAAQVLLGHSKADVTQVYAERDWELGRHVAGQLG